MRISDWSSDLCSSDLGVILAVGAGHLPLAQREIGKLGRAVHEILEIGRPKGVGGARRRGQLSRDLPVGAQGMEGHADRAIVISHRPHEGRGAVEVRVGEVDLRIGAVAAMAVRSEEHTSELQSLMRISYAVFCLKKKNSTSR